jgi:hypothetical protein
VIDKKALSDERINLTTHTKNLNIQY